MEDLVINTQKMNMDTSGRGSPDANVAASNSTSKKTEKKFVLDKEADMLILSSTGPSADNGCGGVFIKAGIYNSRPFYRQLHTLNTECTTVLFSINEDEWIVMLLVNVH